MKTYLPLIATVLLIGACTLEMEDYTIPEEERGRDEIYTVENEFGTISYQFKDSVLHLTDNLRERYLVRVEDDSILYISSSIPDEWRPYVGQKVAASISHQLPWGMNHRVIAVQDVGGIYKVTTTHVSTDEIYEELKICLDADVASPDFDGMTEEEIADYGYEKLIDPQTGDTVYMDWNDYDIAHGLRPASARRSSLTRALSAQTRGDDEEEENGYVDDQGVSKSVFCDQFWDTRDLSGLAQGGSAMYKAWNFMFTELQKAAKKAGEGGGDKAKWNPYFGLGLKIEDFKKVHIEEDKKRKYEFKYTDSWSEWTFKAEGGFSLQPNFDKDKQREGYGDPVNMYRQMISMRTDVNASKLVKNKIKCRTTKSWDRAKVRIPLGFIGAVPIAVVIGATLTPQIELDGSLALTATYTSDKVRNYHKVEDGKTEDWSETLETGHLSKTGITGKASVKIGAKVRGYAGIEVGATVGVTIGINLDAYVEGEVNVDIVAIDLDEVSHHNFDDGIQLMNCKAAVRFACGFYWDIQLFVAPLGIDVWSHDLYKSNYLFLVYKELSSGPTIRFPVYSSAFFGNQVADNVPDDFGYINASFVTGEIQENDIFMKLHDYRPGMRIYFGPIKDNHWTYMTPSSEEYGPYTDMGNLGKVKGGTTYRFIWIGSLEDAAKENDMDKISEVHMVPFFYYYDNFNPSGHKPEEAFKHINKGGQMVFDDLAGWQFVADPYIYTRSSGQFSVVDLGMQHKGSLLGDWGDHTWVDEKHVRRFSFYTTVVVMGGSRMKEWGLDIKIYDPWKKRIKNSHKTIKVDNLRSGTYTFIISFDSDWEPNSSLHDDKDPTKEIPNQLYYTVKPYWNNPFASDAYIYADDKKSTAKYPITYDFDDPVLEDAILKNKELFGDVTYEFLNTAK